MTENARSDFESRIQDGLGWLGSSRQLLHAAQAIGKEFDASLNQHKEGWRERQVGLMRGTMLLAGLAVENAFKGLAAHVRDGVVATDGRLALKAPFNNQDLHEMASRLGVVSDGRMSDLLRRLSQAVRWGGRYPIPLRDSHMPKDGVSLSRRPGDLDDVARLIAEIEARVCAT